MILDTNALSAVADGEASATEVVGQADRLAIPVVVLGEYRLGIEQSRHKLAYQNWLEEWIGAVPVLSVDEETARFYAVIGFELKGKGTPIPINDLWIAALSRQHSLPVLSRDRHFDLVAGLRRVNW